MAKLGMLHWIPNQWDAIEVMDNGRDWPHLMNFKSPPPIVSGLFAHEEGDNNGVNVEETVTAGTGGMSIASRMSRRL